ncbi:hypothetical protein Poly51_31880 [Rubripirellula tenax]|uniref:Uncharacterized protein n=1 Tax=Rubripirellula tenax TaxID=2528015 RepID=A0A5C6F3U5_9BACT|nr:hypothetical protein [Rubripirellula tenax]TWU54469.1 hypothetical protein Poly51_31880 [Rubripirellula tenax]
MRRSIALSLLAALSGSTYAQPTSSIASHPTRTVTSQAQTAEPSELTEKQRIMIEVRRQVGSELNEN